MTASGTILLVEGSPGDVELTVRAFGDAVRNLGLHWLVLNHAPPSTGPPR